MLRPLCAFRMPKSRPRSPSLEENPRKKTSPFVDSRGFKRSQASVDAEKMSAFTMMGGETHDNLADMPKTKTMHEEEEEAKYVIDGPLRRINPYYFTYMTFCKQRWRDKKVLDVFTSEFRLYPEAYYVNALNSHRVFLNDKEANIDSVVRNGDKISHRIHRHEPPVTSRPIRIVHEDADYVVIDKPSGIPVHPTGRFRYNTITMILEKELGIKAHPCNRLDRLTSGLMLLGKNGKAANRMSQILRQRRVTKQYVAKVVGEFPCTPATEEVVVDKPILSVDPRLALNCVDEEHGKVAKTVFKRLSYDGENSIVLCTPLTGRTHQIRVHLQYLGYPIVNDPVYSSPLIWGPEIGKEGHFDMEKVKQKLANVGKTEVASTFLHPHCEGEVLSGRQCEICQAELYTDPGPNDLDLYLHAYKYSSKEGAVDERFVSEQNRLEKEVEDIGSWSYQTELPDWALESQRKYMALALEQAQKCAPTTTAFCVGAVLVNGGKILETGYSRELEGNTHAEQNALEKYFRKSGTRDVPEGTELYTTMEPCSERLSGNLPCLQRILALNGHISTCYVGVMEPSTFIAKNVSYEQLTEHGISYIKIPGFEEEALKAAKKGHK